MLNSLRLHCVLKDVFAKENWFLLFCLTVQIVLQVRWPRGSLLAHQFFWNVFELVVGFACPIVVMSVGYWRLLRGLFYATRTVADPSDASRLTVPTTGSGPSWSSVRSVSLR